MNPLELDEKPYYSELVFISESRDEFGLYYYTITIIAEAEGYKFQFEQELTWFDGSEDKVSEEEIEKYFNDELLDKDIDLTDMKCWRNNFTESLEEQMRYACIS